MSKLFLKVVSDLVVSVILEWNKLDTAISNSTYLLQFVRPSPNSHFNCHGPKDIEYEIRPRLGLSHLREQKFKHSFQDTQNRFCEFGCEIEACANSPLHCSKFYTKRNTLSTKPKAFILLH